MQPEQLIIQKINKYLSKLDGNYKEENCYIKKHNSKISKKQILK